MGGCWIGCWMGSGVITSDGITTSIDGETIRFLHKKTTFGSKPEIKKKS